MVSVGVSAAVTAIAGANPDLVILHTGAGSFLKIYKYTDEGSGVQFVAVSPLANQVKLSNFSPTNTIEVALAWGIDG